MSKPSEDLGVEVITAYEFRQVGQVFFPPEMLRERLVKCGLVRRRTAGDVAKEATDAAPDSRRPGKKPTLFAR